MAISLRDPLGVREDFVSTEIAVEYCLLSQRMPSSVAVPTVIRIPAFLEIQLSPEIPTLMEKPTSLRTLLHEEPVFVRVQFSV